MHRHMCFLDKTKKFFGSIVFFSFLFWFRVSVENEMNKNIKRTIEDKKERKSIKIEYIKCIKSAADVRLLGSDGL